MAELTLLAIIKIILMVALAFLLIRIAARALSLDDTEKNILLIIVIALILFWLF